MEDRVEATALPEEVDFVQSTEQAFYLIEDLTIDGETPREDDILIAFNDDALVGSAWYDGEYTAVPVMGKDNNPYTESYCQEGDTPTFKLLRQSTGEMFSLNGQTQGWSSLGVNMLKLSGTTMEIPESFGLGTPYPNPFNPVTAFSYDLPEKSEVNISIYSLSGHVVAELVNGVVEPGKRKEVWDAGNLPSGVYLIRMEAVSTETNSRYSDTRKVIMVK